MNAIKAGIAVIAVFIFAQNHAHGIDLRIEPEGSNQLRFTWTGQSGVDYDLKTIASMDPFALWASVSEIITAGDTNTVFITPLPEETSGIYRVFDMTASYPLTGLTSHTNQQVVSGEIELTAFAYDDSRLSAVTFFVDNIPTATLTEGQLRYTLNTQHFSNGVHNVRVEAQDNFGIGTLGGDSDALVMVNAAVSTNIQLVFSNAVRWVDAESLFETDVPIVVDTDIFPADWTVLVRDDSNMVVRTMTGTTSGSQIVTNWNGLDQLGDPVPSDAAYQIEVQIVGNSSEAMSSSLSGPSGGYELKSDAKSSDPSGAYELKGSAKNAHGVEERIYQKTVEEKPAWTQMTLEETAWNEKTEQYEVTVPAKYDWVGDWATYVVEKRIPTQSLASTLENGGSEAAAAAAGGTVTSSLWREAAWSSGQILLARQQYRLSLVGATFNAALGQFMNQLAANIDTVAGDIGGNRATFNSTVQVMAANGDYQVLLNGLINSDVRALYYHGHANAEAIGYSELVLGDGLTPRTISGSLSNAYYLSLTNSTGTQVVPAKYRFLKPFNFVFIDGCNSANGNFPEAFGIPKAILAYAYATNKKKRAFMGWSTLTRDSIVNNSFQTWSASFWNAWLGNSGNTQLADAINAADIAHPDVGNQDVLVVYGTRALKWNE